MPPPFSALLCCNHFAPVNITTLMLAVINSFLHQSQQNNTSQHNPQHCLQCSFLHCPSCWHCTLPNSCASGNTGFVAFSSCQASPCQWATQALAINTSVALVDHLCPTFECNSIKKLKIGNSPAKPFSNTCLIAFNLQCDSHSWGKLAS